MWAAIEASQHIYEKEKQKQKKQKQKNKKKKKKKKKKKTTKKEKKRKKESVSNINNHGFKALLQLANFTLDTDAILDTEIH